MQVESTRRSAIETLIKDWKGEGIRRPSENLMLSGTNLDVYELNAKAQALRFQAGKLTGEGISIGKQRR